MSVVVKKICKIRPQEAFFFFPFCSHLPPPSLLSHTIDAEIESDFFAKYKNIFINKKFKSNEFEVLITFFLQLDQWLSSHNEGAIAKEESSCVCEEWHKSWWEKKNVVEVEEEEKIPQEDEVHFVGRINELSMEKLEKAAQVINDEIDNYKLWEKWCNNIFFLFFVKVQMMMHTRHAHTSLSH